MALQESFSVSQECQELVLKITFIVFSKYKSNKYYCRIFETVTKILKRKINFARYSTISELQSHEAHLHGDLCTKEASTALRSEACLGFIEILLPSPSYSHFIFSSLSCHINFHVPGICANKRTILTEL